MTTHYFDPPLPRLFGHRGSSAHFPENTLPAFDAALVAGVPYLELDVRGTADGQVVVHHDATALRLCGVDRPIAELTFAELKRLDAGSYFSADGGRTFPFCCRGVTIPTLAELFEAFPEAFFNIEIKQSDPPIEERTVDLIRRAEKEAQVLLAAEQDAIMPRLRQVCGEIPTSLSYGETAAFFDWLKGGCDGPYHPPGRALQIPEAYEGQRLVFPQMLEAAHAVGLEVHVWTVNEPADMARLLAMAVDGLMSDYPERLVAERDVFLGRTPAD
jgi:glycerophosphoryl diester phosphodiesterase